MVFHFFRCVNTVWWCAWITENFLLMWWMWSVIIINKKPKKETKFWYLCAFIFCSLAFFKFYNLCDISELLPIAYTVLNTWKCTSVAATANNKQHQEYAPYKHHLWEILGSFFLSSLRAANCLLHTFVFWIFSSHKTTSSLILCVIRNRDQYFVSVVKVLTWINMTRSEFRWLSVVSHQPQYQITCILSTMLCHVKCRSHSVNYIVRFVRRRNYNFGESRFSKEKSHTNGKIKFRQTFRSMLNKYVQISWWCINHLWSGRCRQKIFARYRQRRGQVQLRMLFDNFEWYLLWVSFFLLHVCLEFPNVHLHCLLEWRSFPQVTTHIIFRWFLLSNKTRKLCGYSTSDCGIG